MSRSPGNKTSASHNTTRVQLTHCLLVVRFAAVVEPDRDAARPDRQRYLIQRCGHLVENGTGGGGQDT